MSMAVDYFERVRSAAARLEPCQRELSALEEAEREVTPWTPTGGGGGGSKFGHSDPTASAAEGRAEGLSRALDAKRAELDALEGVIGDCLVVLEGVRRGMGAREAEAMELYYVDRAGTWSEVAWELGCSLSTVQRMRDKVISWMDAVGVATVKRGIYDDSQRS